MLPVYILVILSFLLKSSYQNCVQERAVRMYDFDGLKMDEYLLWSEQGLAAFICFDKCSRDPRCHSFQVKRNTGTCRGHSASFASPYKLYYPTETVSGFKLFLMQSAANYFGDACVDNAECRLTNSTCIDGVCVCRVGYMFSPSDSACSANCAEWSDDFTRYDGRFISGMNNVTYDGLTEAECRSKCVEANNSSFTCVSAEYFSPKCNLGIYSGQLPEHSYKTYASSLYYQRNCAP